MAVMNELINKWIQSNAFLTAELGDYKYHTLDITNLDTLCLSKSSDDILSRSVTVHFVIACRKTDGVSLQNTVKKLLVCLRSPNLGMPRVLSAQLINGGDSINITGLFEDNRSSVMVHDIFRTAILAIRENME